MMRRISATFVTGLFTILPLVITIGLMAYLVVMLNNKIGPSSPFGYLLKLVFGDQALGILMGYVVSVVIVLVFIWLVGYFTTKVLGRRIGEFVAAMISRVPFVNKVYGSVEQAIGLMRQGGQNDAAAALANVVFARIANTTVLGMLASSEPVMLNGVKHYLVYFPSTPVPATGFNYLIPADDVWDANISVEEMTKVILSLGSLGPTVMNNKDPLVFPLGAATSSNG